MMSVGELSTHGGSGHEDSQGVAPSGGGAEGYDVPTSIVVKRWEMPKDVPMQ